ncbi:MAG: TraR/DksA C4-type zinc finger protein [Patescibacteria group bacterium]|nr:TraR/DksA C4-type zinc finger protein [Patescibacteria group bacterium]MDD5715506.1 TraR/DksA C4-type zinc finger protein [Patescibacteria group bacterium]
MDSSRIEEVKAKLVAEKTRIAAQLKEMTEEQTFDKDKTQTKWRDIGDKEEDNAVEVADFQDSIALERNLEVTLEKIERALKKIELGTYGVCESCGKPIDDGRLAAYPEAQHCMACHTKR